MGSIQHWISKWYVWVIACLVILLIILVVCGKRESEFVGIGSYDDVMARHGISSFDDTTTTTYSSGSKRERECRSILESIFGKPFPTKRPSFLKNPETGRNLELDCYNEELKLALEYNGKQHYVYPNSFHKTKEDFIQQLRRDRYKREVCDREGIFLITVPYNIEDLQEYIADRIPPSLTHKIAIRLANLSRV